MYSRLMFGIMVTILGTSCNPDKIKDPTKKSSDSKDAQVSLAPETESFPVPGAKLNYPELYCQHVGKLKLNVDVSEPLGKFCQDGKPTPFMLEYRDESLQRPDQKYTIRTIYENSDRKQEQSEFIFVWSFTLPLRPFNVKEHPIYEYIVKPFKNERMDMRSNFVKRTDDPSVTGLHLWSVDVNYDITIFPNPGLTLKNTRKTRYDLYQVQSASEEMGFGVEYLMEVDKYNFSKYTFLNIAFNDGGGFNDGRGKSVIIGYLHLQMNNQGFPQVAKQTALEIAETACQNLFDGLNAPKI